MERSREHELERGERRVITVLFADIAGSTKRIAALEPEDAQDFLDEALDNMIERVHIYGGHVVQTLGDGIMAVFGTPTASEDHALRACFAGIAIRDSFQGGRFQAAQVRVGIHSGQAIVKWRNNDFGRELHSIGSTVHIAARTEAMAPPGAVAISSITADLAAASSKTRPLGQIDKDESGESAIHVLELLEIEANESVDKSFLRRAPNPLVDRRAELKRITDLIQAAQDGRAASLAIVGEAGIGKSRLAYEAHLRCARANIACESIRGFSVKSDTPFAALQPLMARLLDRGGELVSDDFDAKLRACGLVDNEILVMRTMLGLSAADNEAWRALAADERNKATVDGATKVLAAASAQAPVVLVVEDLHFLDRETLNVLMNIRTALEKAALGLIVTTRPEALSEARAICAAIVELAPLDAKHARQLAEREFLASTPDGEGLDYGTIVDAIVARAGGIPLAVEEFSRMAGGTLAASFHSRMLPISLENAFISRLAGLTVEARMLAQAASVFGVEFELSVLKSTADLDDAVFDRSLRTLVEQRFLEVLANGGARFSHQLMQEACYSGVVKKQRQDLHRAAYAVIDVGSDPARRTDQELARHALAAGERRTALQHLWDATIQAISSAAIDSVVALYRKAKAICDDMGADADVDAARFSLLVFDAFQQLGDQEELVGALNACKATMARIESVRGAIQCDIHLAMAHWVGGRLRLGLECAQRAVSSVTEQTDLPLAVYAKFTLANLEFANGAPVQAVARLRELIALLSGKLKTARFGAMISIPGVMTRAFASWYLTYLGEYEEAELYHLEVEKVAHDLDHDYSRLLGHIALGSWQLRTGAAKDAAATFAAAHRICMANRYFGLEPSVSAWYAQTLIASGRIGLAQTVLTQSFQLGNYEKVRNVGHYLMFESKARLANALGEHDEALAVINHALAVAKTNEDNVHLAYGRLLRAEIQILRDDHEAAIADLRGAAVDAARMGLMPLAEECEAHLRAIVGEARHAG